MDEKRFWIDFVEGRISVPEMLERTEAEPALLDWLTKIADPKFKTTVTTIEIDEDGWKDYIHTDHPFDAKLQIYEYIYSGFASGKLGRYLNVHGYFSRILTTAFPEEGIVVDQTLEDKFCFMLHACPSYIGGPEVDHLLDELLETLPEGLSKTKRAKLYKEKVKELFGIQDKKYPRWVQEAEWPIAPSGRPMRFVEQKRAKGKEYAMTLLTHYVFEDPDTGEQRIVDQYT